MKVKKHTSKSVDKFKHTDFREAYADKLMSAVLDCACGLFMTVSSRVAGFYNSFSIFMAQVAFLHAQLSLFLSVNVQLKVKIQNTRHLSIGSCEPSDR